MVVNLTLALFVLERLFNWAESCRLPRLHVYIETAETQRRIRMPRNFKPGEVTAKTEEQRRLFMLAYILSTKLSCDNGEQPKFHTKYCRMTTPLDLNREELTRELRPKNIEETANELNTLGLMYGTTLARPMFALAKVKYEVLDLSSTLELSFVAGCL